MHLHLKVHKQFQILRFLVGILLHELCERLAGNVLGRDRPLAVGFGNLQHLGNVQPGLLDQRLIECLVEDSCLGVILVKHLDDAVAVQINGLGGPHRKDLVCFHVTLLLVNHTFLCSPV